MRIAILGLGREGRSLPDYLKKQSKKDEFWILDADQNVPVPKGFEACLGADYLKNLTDFNLIYRTPGIPYSLKELESARKKGVLFTSLTKLFFDEVAKIGATIVGITGTKGKGTTSTMLYNILKASKKNAYLVGNIGTPALSVLSKLKKNSIVVYELSSFQLQDLHRGPHIAVILDIAPDHLDAHKTFKEYVEAKAQITYTQKKNDYLVYSADNRYTKAVAKKSRAKKIPVSLKDRAPISVNDLYIPAPHLLKNALMARAAAKLFGCNETVIKKAIQKFRGNKYRLGYVGTKHGVSYYNDSAATNPLSTIAALHSFKKPIVLIAGGKDKNIDYGGLSKAINRAPVKLVILIGENKRKLKKHLKKVAIKNATSLKDAVSIAKKTAQAGDVVLFSPGSSSFDMFKNYEERGQLFNKFVKASQ